MGELVVLGLDEAWQPLVEQVIRQRSAVADDVLPTPLHPPNDLQTLFFSQKRDQSNRPELSGGPVDQARVSVGGAVGDEGRSVLDGLQFVPCQAVGAEVIDE